MDRTSRHHHGGECVKLGILRLSSLLFADAMVLLVSMTYVHSAQRCQCSWDESPLSKTMDLGGNTLSGLWIHFCLKWRNSIYMGILIISDRTEREMINGYRLCLQQ